MSPAGGTRPDGTFTNIDFPNNANGNWASSIDQRGDIVGFGLGSKHAIRYAGYLRLKNGSYIELHDPDAGSGPGQGTAPLGINQWGDIVGGYFDSTNTEHAFLLHGGVYRTFDEPNAVGGTTTPVRIDSAGDVIGNYSDANNELHGFVKRGHHYTTIDDPYGGVGNDLGTEAGDMNSHGVISGTFYDANNVAHGFLFHAGKYVTLPDHRKAGYGGGEQGTYAFDFNPYGGLVMNYITSDGINYGALLCNGKYTEFDDPHAKYVPGQGYGSQLNDVAADNGDGVGMYFDSNGVWHLYLYRPRNAPVHRRCREDRG